MTSILKNVTFYKIKNFDDYKKLILHDLFFSKFIKNNDYEIVLKKANLDINLANNGSAAIFSIDKLIPSLLIRILIKSIEPYDGNTNNKLSNVSLNKITSGFNPKLSFLDNIKFKLLLLDINIHNDFFKHNLKNICNIFKINGLNKPLGNFDQKLVEDFLVIFILHFKKDIYIFENFFGLNSSQKKLTELLQNLLINRNCIFFFNKINKTFIHNHPNINQFFFLDKNLSKHNNLNEIKKIFDLNLQSIDANIENSDFKQKRIKYFQEDQFLSIDKIFVDGKKTDVMSILTTNYNKVFSINIFFKCSYPQDYFGGILQLIDSKGNIFLNKEIKFNYHLDSNLKLNFKFDIHFSPDLPHFGLNFIPYIAKRNYLYSHKIKILVFETSKSITNKALHNIKLKNLVFELLKDDESLLSI